MSTAIAAERIPLSFLLAQNRDEDPPVEPVVPFTAWRQEASGEWWPVNVTALMERTAAFRELDDRYATGVLRLDRVFVEPATIEWRAVLTPRPQGRHWKGAVSRDVTHGRARSDARQRSDERAIADQERRRHEEQLEREQLAAQRVPQSAQPSDAGAFTADQAEGEPMAKRIDPKTAAELKAKGLKRCPKCKRDRPIDEFNAAGYCSCRFDGKAAARPELRKPATIPSESPKTKVVHMPTLVKVIASPPSLDPPANGGFGHTGLGGSDTLVELVKDLIAERNALRAQLNAIEQALVHA